MALAFIPTRKQMDFTTKNAAILIVMVFTLVFMIGAVGLAMLAIKFPAVMPFSLDLWKMFGSSYGALFIALNVATGQPLPDHTTVKSPVELQSTEPALTPPSTVKPQ